MDSDNKLLIKTAAEAAGLDGSRASKQVYIKIQKGIVRKLENKKQKLTLEAAEMRVKVMERQGELSLLQEQIRSEEKYVESRRQYQAQLVRRVEMEKANFDRIVKTYQEVGTGLKETWKNYLEIYNRFPLALKKAALEKEVKLKKFQLKVEVQRGKDLQQVYDNTEQMKKLIRESREKKMAAVRVTIEEKKVTLAELLKIKQEKLELLSRLKAVKAAKEREEQQLSLVKSSGPSGTPFSWPTPLTPAPLPYDAPSPQTTVLMSFNRRIIEERCLIVVSPRPNTRTSPLPRPTVESCSSGTGVEDNNAVNGQGTSCAGDERMEVETQVETGTSLVDVNYGGSSISQNSSMDMFAEDDPTAESSPIQDTNSQTLVVHHPEPSPSPQFTVRQSAPEAPIFYGNIQSHTTTKDRGAGPTSSPLCTSSISHSAPALAHTKPTDVEKVTEPVFITSRPTFLTLTTKPRPVYATPVLQMRSSISAWTTHRPMHKGFAAAPHPMDQNSITHQYVAPPATAPRPTHQNVALRAPSTIQQHRALEAHRPTHRNVTSSTAAPLSTPQNIASRAGFPIQEHINNAAPCPAYQNVASSTEVPCPTHQNVASSTAAPRPTHQNEALRASSPSQQHGTNSASRMTHQNVASSTAAPLPTPQSVASRAPSPIQQHGTNAASRLAHQNVASSTAAPLPTPQNVVSRAPSPIQQHRTNSAPRLTHQNVASSTAAPLPTPQNVGSRAPSPIQQHGTNAASRLTHQNVASSTAAPLPTPQNVGSRAPSPIQQHGTNAASRLAHQNVASSAAASLPIQHSVASRSQPVVGKVAAPMRDLHAGGTPQTSTLTAHGSQIATPVRSTLKTQMSRFHPYMSPRNDASGNPRSVNTLTHSVSQPTHAVSQPAPSEQSVSQSVPGVRVSAQNPRMGDRRVSSQLVLPSRNAVTAPAGPARPEPTPAPAETHPNFVTRKSPSPALRATATQKTIVATTQQAAVNQVPVGKPEDPPSEGEKSHYFNRQAAVSENQQGNQERVISDPGKECHEGFDLAQESEANSDQDRLTSEGGQDFNPQGSDDVSMGDFRTSPPFPIDDDEDISPPRNFTSPLSDFGADNACNDANFGSLFGNPFGGSSNATANGNASAQGNTATPFSFSAVAPTSNPFKFHF